ncbi:amino acid adenylation domain-containing protein [Actinophytocola sp. KF-1]
MATSSHRTVVDLVREHAAREPDRPAVLGAETLTYGQLLRQVCGVREWLRGRRIGSGDRVAVVRGRGTELVALILGILDLGAVYVPVDPTHPAPLRDRMLALTRPRLTVDDRTALPAPAAPAPAPAPARAGHADDTAYVIFTSGSTGDPKGVALTHAGLLDYALALPARVGMAAGDRSLGLAPPGFSSSLRQLLLPLATGAATVIASDDEVRTPWQFLDLLARHRVTQLDVVPSFWRVLTAVEDDGELRAALRHVRRVLFASERLDAGLVQRTVALTGGCRVWNMYGCSETTGIVAARDVTDAAEGGDALPIGDALDHVRLTTRGEPGETELVVTGRAVTTGYLPPAAGTVEHLADGTRRLATGDLVDHDPATGFVWRGRKDRQSKVRGFRVNHTALEAELDHCPGVECSAVVTAGEDGVEVAYVSSPGVRLDPADLIEWSRRHLPLPMVPAVAHRIEDWPRLRSGKTDLVHLRHLCGTRASRQL